MFLSKLKSEEKEYFLDLGIHLASSDGDFSDVEKENIKQMCQEMAIEERFDAKLNFEEALGQISEISDAYERKIVMIELAGIIMADGICTSEEKDHLKKIAEAMDINESECDTVIKLVSSLYGIYREIGTYLASK